ncbi:MAG: hypothetical protein SOV61_06815 [Lachnospiraceae bacterium]|nr:hypothetical protein [Lachnospiraceae bacterium]
MMPKYTTKEIKLEELYLDEKNPRFIVPPNPSQQSIVDYLIENEEVEQLANDIAKSGGLNAGERVIVTEENGRWIVLEGNRRICACKILMNPTLLANRRLASVDKIALLVNDELKQSLAVVDADVMRNRLEAQSSLAAKHIDGIKRWSTISKHKFFALEFDAGKSIKEISMITGVSEAKIKTGLKEYRIIDYVLKLPFWTQEEREEYLNLQEIKTTRLTRLFSAQPSKTEGKRLREIIDLDYDDNYFIKSSLDRDVFDKILHIVAQAAFVPNYASNFNGTRSTYEDIPQLMQFLEENKLVLENASGEKKVYVAPSSQQDDNKKAETSQTEGTMEDKKATKATSNKQFSSKRNVLIPEDFAVNCTVVKINDIIYELKRLNFGYCVNAQAVLLRVLLELSLKYYLNRVNESNKIDEGHLEGTYVAALESMRVKKLLNSVEHSNLVQLKKSDKIFSIFNGYVHYDSVMPSKDVLIFYFDNLRRIIEICLNS